MCYAIPAKITQIDGEEAIVDYGGVIKKTNISLVSNVSIGDYVLIHAGFAIEKLDKKSAEESLEIIKNDLGQFSDSDFTLEGREELEKMKNKSENDKENNCDDEFTEPDDETDEKINDEEDLSDD